MRLALIFEQFEMYTMFTDPKQTASTKKTILGELTKIVRTGTAEATNGKVLSTFHLLTTFAIK
jgi:hypothetical protein